MEKDPRLIVHTTNPINAEPPIDVVRETFITDQKKFYVRNHGDIPQIEVSKYILFINGLVEDEIQLSYDQIVNDFEKHTVMATLQCAGNRRTQLIDFAPVPGEVPWQEGAIGNATWSGARLKDILLKIGCKPEALFVEFMGAEDVIRHDENVGFGASISIEKAMTDDVLLAYEMNGKKLEPTHGFPIRALVPGYIGARSVKWLTRITLLDAPSKNYFQNHAYQLFPPHESAETVDWNSGIQLSELDINCVITEPKNHSILEQNKIKIKGYAMSGRNEIVRVDVSIDGGISWQEAKITEGNKKWSWAFWEIELPCPSGKYTLVAKAFDSAGNTQPEEVKQVWNFKGYMNNAWHKIQIQMK